MCLSSMSLWDQHHENQERSSGQHLSQHHPHSSNNNHHSRADFNNSASVDSMSDSTSTSANHHLPWQMPNFKESAYIQAATAPFVYPYSRHTSSPGEVFGYGLGGNQGQPRYASPGDDSGNFFANSTATGHFESTWQHSYQTKCEPPDYATVAATMAAAAVCRQAQYIEDFYSRKRAGKNKGRLHRLSLCASISHSDSSFHYFLIRKTSLDCLGIESLHWLVLIIDWFLILLPFRWIFSYQIKILIDF